MMKGPILEEVHAIRDDIAREHDYDLDSIFRMFREMGESSGRPHVSPPPPHVEPLPPAAQLHVAADEPLASPKSRG